MARLNQFYYLFYTMTKEQEKIQNSEYDTEVLKLMMDWFNSAQEHHQGTTMLLVNRLKVLSAWNDVLHGGLMVTIGMVFYLSFRFALLEGDLWIAQYYAIATIITIPYGALQFYRAGKDLREAEEKHLSLKKLLDEN